MNVVVWTENMSVGVKTIDNQHKTLIDAINNFYNAIGGKLNKEPVIDLIKKMKDYSIFHFNAEEMLLKKHAYPDLDKQKEEHKSFILKIEDLDKRLKEGKLVLSLELTSFIKSWLTNHIMVVDKKYTNYLNSKGVF